ncbi:MAG: class II glutamine amidotransferase, partial [Myxococcales bacterium]|nr:class II glutamine amidotransferase [Myxococcales bacterium]
NPNGTGLTVFAEDGSPVVWRQPLAAYEDQLFAEEARDCESTVFVAHVRYATTGPAELRNTHPFEQRGRVFAHNGVLGDLKRLEEELGEYMDLVGGDTDSERFFALVTKHADSNGGDVGAAITTAARWAEENLPIYALNVVLATASELWALRYPETHDLFVLRRAAGGPHGGRHLEHASRAGRIRVRSGALAERPAVVVASERMDEDPAWSNLHPGELLHVDASLSVARSVILPEPPRHRLTLDDLGEAAAAQAAR